MATGNSSRHVQYDLRACKQVERRMLVDAFQRLMQAGIPIQDYQYTGMGSIHFVDFVLMHRYLGINKMLSVEKNVSLKKSIEFNCPFGCIDTRVADIGDVIPDLSSDVSHILWLDYDGVIENTFTRDLMLAIQQLPVGSIVLITVDVDPPGPASAEPAPEEWKSYYKEEVGTFLEEKLPVNEFRRSNLPALNTQILNRAIKRAMSGREHLSFEPLFNFLYADGHPMITLGGMLAGDAQQRSIHGSSLKLCNYFRSSFSDSPFEIRVPVVTRRERLFLDRNMPLETEGWTPDEFELSVEDVVDYKSVYRYLPIFAELVY